MPKSNAIKWDVSYCPLPAIYRVLPALLAGHIRFEIRLKDKIDNIIACALVLIYPRKSAVKNTGVAANTKRANGF